MLNIKARRRIINYNEQQSSDARPRAGEPHLS